MILRICSKARSRYLTCSAHRNSPSEIMKRTALNACSEALPEELSSRLYPFTAAL